MDGDVVCDGVEPSEQEAKRVFVGCVWVTGTVTITGTCVVTSPPPIVFTCVTAVLEMQPVLFDPLKVPVAMQVCCTVVVTAWSFPTLCESDVDVVNVVIVVYSVAVADGVQDMVL